MGFDTLLVLVTVLSLLHVLYYNRLNSCFDNRIMFSFSYVLRAVTHYTRHAFTKQTSCTLVCYDLDIYIKIRGLPHWRKTIKQATINQYSLYQ